MKRDDLQKWSQAAGRKSVSKPAVQKDSPFRVIDLPGVRDLERRLLLYGDDPHRVEDEVAHVARQLFGIDHQDTDFKVPEEYWGYSENSIERGRINALYRIHEEQFETGEHLTDDEAMVILGRLGLDFSDDRGQPLRCTKLMSRPAEAAARGISGKMPDRDVAGLTQWEDALKRDSEAFLTKKRKGSS
jgi:hypothetical protein